MLLNFRKRLALTLCPELSTERRRLERDANIDALTEIASRRAFDLALPTAEADAQTSIILFDVNNFKEVNTKRGQTGGDAFLKKIADSLGTVARNYGLRERCFRVGGDEFAIIAPARFAEQIRNHAERHFGAYVVGSKQVSITGSIGASYEKADRLLQGRKTNQKGTFEKI